MTTNIEEFAAILQAPPADLLNQFDFLADLPAGRSLEGYIPPETLEYQMSGPDATPRGRRAAADRVRDHADARDPAGDRGQGPDDRPGGDHRQHRGARGGPRRGAAAHRGGLHQPLPEPGQRRDQRPAQRRPDAPVRADHRPGAARSAIRSSPTSEARTCPSTTGAASSGGRSSRSAAVTSRSRRSCSASRPTRSRACRRCRSPRPRIGSIEAVATAPLDDGFLFFVAGCPGGDARRIALLLARRLPSTTPTSRRPTQECAGQ